MEKDCDRDQIIRSSSALGLLTSVQLPRCSAVLLQMNEVDKAKLER